MLDALPGTLLMQWLGVPVLEALSSLAPDGRRRHDERVEPEVEARVVRTEALEPQR